MILSCLQRAQAGAALLDQKRPGWYNEIDLGVFDISNIRYCILAQLYGDWGDGWKNIAPVDEPSCVPYGFDHDSRNPSVAPNTIDCGTKLTNRYALQNAWLSEIYHRRLRDQIQTEAYLLWEAAGKPQDDGQYFWQQAEDKLTNKTWNVFCGELTLKGYGSLNEVLALALTYADNHGIPLVPNITAEAEEEIYVRETTKELQRTGLWTN